MDYWRSPMTDDDAKRLLGSDQFDYAVKQGSGFCSCRAKQAWYANDAEEFGAYRAAERSAIFQTLLRQGFKPEQHIGYVLVNEPVMVLGASGVRHETHALRISSHDEAMDFIANRQ